MIGAVGRRSVRGRGARRPARRGVTLELETSDEPTGVALIQVDDDGETTISVASGANATVRVSELPPHDAVLCQLEISDEAVLAAGRGAPASFLPSTPRPPGPLPSTPISQS